MQYICHQCGRVYPLTTAKYKCACGGLFDLQGVPLNADWASPSRLGINSLWRYQPVLPFADAPELAAGLSLGEGMTPLFPYKAGLPQVAAKADYYMPTLSFKDRGAVVLTALAKKLGVTAMVADSSGNAGTAIAAYAARASITCHVFAPASTSEKKLRQIQAYGAILHTVEGSREDTAQAAIRMVEAERLFYASHIYNPFFYEGTKTYVYEIYQQLGGRLPDDLIIPTGNGTLLLGAYKALLELKQQGAVSSWPRLLAVQAANCAPVYQAFAAEKAEVAAALNLGTSAEGIAIAAPSRGEQILEAIRSTGGRVLAVSEEEILAAQKELLANGISVEITSAANFAAFRQLEREEVGFGCRSVVFPLCGAGLKSL